MASPPPRFNPRRLRSILLRPSAARDSAATPPRRKGLVAVALTLRGLGCSSSPSATAPHSRGKKKKKAEKSPSSSSPVTEDPGLLPPGTGEATVEAIGLDCRFGAGRRASLIGSPRSHAGSPLFGEETGLLGHRRPSWRLYGSPGLLEELIMFDAGLLLGGMDILDRFGELRLDVDNMTYEEMLELGDKIGHVNTGLQEDEIVTCIRKTKHSIFDALLQFSSDTDRKCSICLDDYGVGDEVGKLGCGHGYHTCCIKQWLLRKNSCPVCKATVGRREEAKSNHFP